MLSSLQTRMYAEHGFSKIIIVSNEALIFANVPIFAQMADILFVTMLMEVWLKKVQHIYFTQSRQDNFHCL